MTLTASTTFGPVLQAGVEDASIRCGFRLIANATGAGKADWQGGVFRFYAGTDRSAPLDTIVLTEEELFGAWALDSVSRQRADTSEWHFSAGIPFEAELGFAYLPRGATASRFATARVVCGPRPDATAGPPTTTLTQVRTSDAELNVGDTVFVTYGAASTNGLWRSGVALSGPFEETKWRPDTLLTAAQHTIAFVVPPLSRLDLPVSVLLLADDIALARTTTLHRTTIQVVDRVAPLIWVAPLPTELATGTSLSIRVTASDNNAVRTVVWELDGEIAERDSITLATPVTYFDQTIAVPVPPAWAMKRAQLRVRVYDDAGLRAPEFVSGPEFIRFHEGFSTSVDSVAYPFVTAASASALDAARGRLFSSLSDPGRIVVTDVQGMTPILAIVLPSPRAIALSRSGDSLFVSQRESRTIRVMSSASGASFGTVRLSAIDSIVPPGMYPWIEPDWIGVTGGGHLLVHLSSLRGVIAVDLVSGVQRYRPEFESPTGGLRAEVTPDGSQVLLLAGDCYRWYIVVSDSLTPCSPPVVGSAPGIRFGASLDRIAVANRILGSDLLPLGPAGPEGQSLPHPDGVHHWTLGDRLFKVRTSDGVVIKSMSMGSLAYRVRWIGMDPVMLVDSWGAVLRIDLTGR